MIYFHHLQESRPRSCENLSTGRLQLMGLALRGQGMFSHANLPIAAETLEYAWLLELTVGQLSGQVTIPQFASLVNGLQEFMFTAMDPENELINSRSFELCQHAVPRVRNVVL